MGKSHVRDLYKGQLIIKYRTPSTGNAISITVSYYRHVLKISLPTPFIHLALSGWKRGTSKHPIKLDFGRPVLVT